MLPHGSAIQVRKEEDHQNTLRRYVTRPGECWVYGTLHAVNDTTTRKSKELVEIRVDDQRVGELTPAMSAEYIPIISQLDDRGRLTAAKLIVKGNQVKAEAVLHAAKAHQLDAAWISANLDDAAPTPDAPRRVLPPDGPPSAVAHTPIPPKPTHIRFHTPPGWPPAPHGWEPGPGWRPDPSWPAAPAHWEYWRAEA
jgi:collagen type III alpha